MKSKIRHYAQEILRILDEEEAEIIEDEVPVEPTPEPIEDKTNDTWTIEQHPISKPLDGRTFPAGTPINFLFMVLKNGEGAVADVIVDLPNGSIDMKSNPNGSLGINQVRLPEGGMTLKATLKDFSDKSALFLINATGSAPKEPKAKEPVNEPIPPVKPKHEKVYAPFLNSGTHAVLVLFGDKNWEWIGETVDVRINDKWFHFSGRSRKDPIWDVSIYLSRGKVVYLNEPVRAVEFDTTQIVRKSEPDNHGFGYFNYKVGASPVTGGKVGDSLKKQKSSETDPNYIYAWHNNFGIQLYRHGSNGRTFDNPNFYKYNVYPSWNETKELKILIGRWEGR